MSKGKRDLQTMQTIFEFNDWASQIATINKGHSIIDATPANKVDIGIADDVSTNRSRISDLEAQLKELKIKKKRRKLKIKVKI